MKIENNVLNADIGLGDSIDNWHEITEEEAERLQSEDVPTEESSESDTQLQTYEEIIDILSGNEEG